MVLLSVRGLSMCALLQNARKCPYHRNSEFVQAWIPRIWQFFLQMCIQDAGFYLCIWVEMSIGCRVQLQKILSNLEEMKHWNFGAREMRDVISNNVDVDGIHSHLNIDHSRILEVPMEMNLHHK